MNKAACAWLLCTLASLTSGANGAVVPVEQRSLLLADDAIDWAVLGPPFTLVPGEFVARTTGGLTLRIANALEPNTPFRVFQQVPPVLERGNWNGNFTPKDAVLAPNGRPGATLIRFYTPVAGVGAQVSPGSFGRFTAVLEATGTDGASRSFSAEGLDSPSADGAAIFRGIKSSTRDIASVMFSTTSAGVASGPGINKLDILSAAPQGDPNPSPAGNTIPTDYQWDRYLALGSRIKPFSIVGDATGNTYVAATATTPQGPMRVVQKYPRDGGAPAAPNQTAWFAATAAGYSDLPWQKIVIDTPRQRAYVYFAADVSGGGDGHHYFLACNRLDTGEKCSDWNAGQAKLVGSSPFLTADFDVDAVGDLWTAYQTRIDFGGGNSRRGFVVKKWSGISANELTTPNQGVFAVPAADRHLVAVRAKWQAPGFYVAYSETAAGSTSPSLSLSSFGESFQFLAKKTYTYSFAEFDNPQALHPPTFTAAVVDQENSLIVGGVFMYTREQTRPDNSAYVLVHPVVVKFDARLDQVYQHVSAAVKAAAPVSEASRPRLGLARWGDDRVLGRVLPLLQGYYFLLDRDGQVVGDATLAGPWSANHDLISYPGGSNQYYLIRPAVDDFVPAGLRLVETGYADLHDPSGQAPGYHGYITTSYGPTFHGPADIPGMQFEWGKILSVAEAMRTLIQFPWPEPGPDPSPCPQCPWPFSPAIRPTLPPPPLRRLHETGFDFASGLGGRPAASAVTVAQALAAARPTPRLSAATKKQALLWLKQAGSSASAADRARAKVLEVMNAMDLDFRVPPIGMQTLRAQRNSQANFADVAMVVVPEVRNETNCQLRLDSGYPALAKGYQPLWPAASYRFGCAARLEDAAIAVYFGGYGFPGGRLMPRVLKWTAGRFEDVTIGVDWQKRLVKARTSLAPGDVFVVLGR